MFIGHLALGFAAKRVAPDVPLPVLLMAPQVADVVWPVLVAAGVEQVRIDPGNTAFTPLDFVSYPYSHSLVALVGWGVAYGLLFGGRARTRGAIALLAALVVSHWLLDWVTHRPDMPLYPGSPRFGLGLWRSIPLTLAVEMPLFAAGLWVYLRTTRSLDKTGGWALVGLIVFLMAAYLSGPLSGPPPSVTALWTVALLGFVLIAWWGWWIERHRALG